MTLGSIWSRLHQILQLATDFPRLWNAPTTAPRDRKRMLRLLIQDITVAKQSDPKQLSLHIRWQGGAMETVAVQLPPSRAEAIRYSETFVGQIRALAAMYDDQEIAERLNRVDLKSLTGKPFTVTKVRWIRYKHRIEGLAIPAGTLSVNEVGARYGVSIWVVYYWIERGILPAQRRKPGVPYAIRLTDTTDRQLRDWIANSRHLPSPNRIVQSAI